MADMLWGQAIQRVRYALDNCSASDVSSEIIKAWLIQSYVHLSNPQVHDHPELHNTENVTLVTGTNQYTIGAGARQIWLVLGVRNNRANQGYRLVPRNERWFRQRVQDIEGRPTDYIHTSELNVPNVLKVYPTPSTEYGGDVLEVETYEEPRTEVSETEDLDPVHMQALWHEPWILGAIWRGWRDMNEPVFADRALNDYAAMINEIKNRVRLEMVEDPRDFDIDIRGSRIQRF